MNKKILSIVLVGAMSIGSLGMAYADDQNDAYKDNKELQEIYKVYENAFLSLMSIKSYLDEHYCVNYSSFKVRLIVGSCRRK